ncbi:MAG: DUF2058 domain-containing protein [Proteobacteria bacterium]|nr:DUF2058 domain-containing protein [Pseudomonadota bacterium]
MRNPLQDQLLKAGLVKKSQVAKVVREQAAQRKSNRPASPDAEQFDPRRLQADKAERDRALAAERNAQARASEAHAQIRQIVDMHKVPREGDLPYRFTDGDRIRNVWVNESLRAQLAGGTLVIARHGQGYELLPRVAAEKVYERDATMIVLDHGRNEASSDSAQDDGYGHFVVPDDLVW